MKGMENLPALKTFEVTPDIMEQYPDTVRPNLKHFKVDLFETDTLFSLDTSLTLTETFHSTVAFAFYARKLPALRNRVVLTQVGFNVRY